MNQREKGYWADLGNLKQELASVVSKKGISAEDDKESMLGDDVHASADAASLPQHASPGEKWPCTRVTMVEVCC